MNEKIFKQFNYQFAEHLLNGHPLSSIRLYKIALRSYRLPELELPDLVITDSFNRILNADSQNFLPHYDSWFYLAKADEVNNSIEYQFGIKKAGAKLLKTAQVQTFIPYNSRICRIPFMEHIDGKIYSCSSAVFKAAHISSWDVKHRNFSNIKKQEIVLYEIEDIKEVTSEKNPEFFELLRKYSKNCSEERNKITEEYINRLKKEILNNQALFPS